MTAMIKTFAQSDSGAVTVDWVVLTAALVGLGLAVMAVVSTGVEDLSAEIQATMVTADPATTFPGADATLHNGGDIIPD